jgi:hypothetical protein
MPKGKAVKVYAIIPAGIAAATSAVPTSAIIHVSTKPATIAEAIEAIIGRAKRKISRSPVCEGNFMCIS